MDLLGMQVAENRRKLKTTVLYRKGGTWHQDEVSRLINGLTTVADEHPRHPEYIILMGHYTKEVTLRALLGGQAYTASQVVGIDNPELPFAPGFA